jgi:hypothetical protein
MAAGVLIVTLLAYLRCLGNRFSLDDLDMIVGNRLIGQWSFLWNSLFSDPYWYRDPLHLPQSSYYRPLQDIWLGVNYHLFGLNPAPWHATMVALHLVAVWLVFRIVALLTADRPTALLAALLFGLLPVHAEAVAWEPGVDLSLCATFELSAFYLFIRRDSSRYRRPLSLLLYGLALFTHESAVAFPGLIALYTVLMKSPAEAQRASARLRSALFRAMPFVAEVFRYLIARRLALGFLLTEPSWVTHLSGAQLLMTLPRVIVAFAAVLVIPWLAGPYRGSLAVSSPLDSDFLLSVGILIAIAVGLLLALRNSSIARRRLYLFCTGWVAIAMAPMMNLRLFFEEAFVQDRYLYLASAGWCLMVADLAVRIAYRGARKMARYGCGCGLAADVRR